MIDVSDIIHDPDFQQDYLKIHVSGSRDDHGTWTTVEQTPIPLREIVLPAKNDELKFLPEGERHEETIAIYSNDEIVFGDMKTIQSDLIIYQGKFYRVAFMKYYPQCNVWYALAVRFHREVPATP